MCRIILVRGIPGSGKTTIAKEFKGFTHLESDMFFEKNGIYVYDHLKIKQAHDWCISSAKNALDRGERVVVSNTFIRLYELKRYIDLRYVDVCTTETQSCANPQLNQLNISATGSLSAGTMTPMTLETAFSPFESGYDQATGTVISPGSGNVAEYAFPL